MRRPCHPWGRSAAAAGQASPSEGPAQKQHNLHDSVKEIPINISTTNGTHIQYMYRIWIVNNINLENSVFVQLCTN